MSNDHDLRQKTVQITSVPARMTEGSAASCVVVIDGERLGKRVDIDQRPIVVGRSLEADLCLRHTSVSRLHCEFWREGDAYKVRDLGATNPTRVNDIAVQEALLVDGDHIAVGECLLKFVSASSAEARYHAEIHQLATNDALTELPNRRHFIEAVDKQIARSLRLGWPLAMCIIDADHFKQINDRYGHIAGDEVLRQLAAILRGKLRGDDIAGRIGGEEFAVVLPRYTTADADGRFAEPLRRAVEQAQFVLGGEPRPLTISVGIASLGPGRDTRSSLMKSADAALYRAKDSGRNRIYVQPEE